MTAEYDTESLKSLQTDDTMTVSEISNKIYSMKKLKEIETKYKSKIKYRKDNKQFYIYVSRKQYASTTLSGLYETLSRLEYGKLSYSLKDLFPLWLIWKRDNTAVSSKTLKEYNNDWKKFYLDSFIIDTPINELKAKDYMNLFRQWTKDRTLTKKHFNNLKSLLNGIFSYAIEEEIIEYNPIITMKTNILPFKPVNNSNDVFSLSDRNQLLEHLKSNDEIYSLAIQLDFYLVLRIGELLALKWTDIEGDNIHIQRQYLLNCDMDDNLQFSGRQFNCVDHVKGYSEQGFRYEPLSDNAKEILSRIRKVNPDGEYIFMQDNQFLFPDTFNERLHKYCKEIGIKSHSSHKIRFSVASILFENGMPLTDLQRLLGHTTLAMTLHYIRKVTPSNDVANVMNRALS